MCVELARSVPLGHRPSFLTTKVKKYRLDGVFSVLWATILLWALAQQGVRILAAVLVGGIMVSHYTVSSGIPSADIQFRPPKSGSDPATAGSLLRSGTSAPPLAVSLLSSSSLGSGFAPPSASCS